MYKLKNIDCEVEYFFKIKFHTGNMPINFERVFNDITLNVRYNNVKLFDISIVLK